MRNPAAPPSFAALVQSFFAEHLTQQRALSARTVAAYRDAFMLFLEFAQARLHKPPPEFDSSAPEKGHTVNGINDLRDEF